MKNRRDCNCPCHSGGVVVRPIPYCDSVKKDRPDTERLMLCQTSNFYSTSLSFELLAGSTQFVMPPVLSINRVIGNFGVHSMSRPRANRNQMEGFMYGIVFVAIHTNVRCLSVLVCRSNRCQRKECKNPFLLPHAVSPLSLL